MIQCEFFKVNLRIYLQNRFQNRNLKATFPYKTSDFTYWDTFSAANSEVFVQENFLKFGQTRFLPSKMALSNSISRQLAGWKWLQIKVPDLFKPIVWRSGAKKFFQWILKFQENFSYLEDFLKLIFRKKYCRSK